MKFECVFKHVKRTEHLVDYAKNKLDKLEKFELKPFQIQVIFSSQAKGQVAELIVITKEKKFVAKAIDDNSYKALDACAQKISRQLQKSKDKVQNHRHNQHSDLYALQCMNDQLEMDYSKITGAAKQKAA